MIEFPNYRQMDQMDCGPTCLRIVARHFGKHFSAQTLRERAQISRDGVSLLGLSEAGETLGLKNVGLRLSLKRLIEQRPLPCIIHWGQNHFVVLYKIEKHFSILGRSGLKGVFGGRTSKNDFRHLEDFEMTTRHLPETKGDTARYSFYISDPAKGLLVYNEQEFAQKWCATNNGEAGEGVALLLEPTKKFYDDDDERQKGIQLSQLFKYLWVYKKLILQLVLGMLTGSLLSLMLPFLTQAVVDIGIGVQDLNFINIILIAQMVLVCSTSAVDFLRSWILLHISTRLNLTILSEFLSKLMRLPISFFDVKRFGDVMQRIGDHQRIEAFLTGQALNALFSVFNLVVFSLLLAYYHILIFQVAMTFSVAYVIWIIAYMRIRRKQDAKRFDVASQNQGQIVQLIQGMQDIKLTGAEILKRWEWEHTQARLFRWNVKNLSLTQIQQAGAVFINQSKNILITYLAAKSVLEGGLTIGEMMSIQFILGQFNSPIEQMVGFLQSWQDAQLSLERLNEVHSLDDEDVNTQQREGNWLTDHDILLRDVTFSYPGAGNEPVLKNLNIRFPVGKTTAIVGTSGSGKTTLLKLLLRFYTPQIGSIMLAPSEKLFDSKHLHNQSHLSMSFKSRDLPISHISHKSWRKKCGVVMQEGYIFSDTVARNIAVGDEFIDQIRLYQATSLANISEFVETLPYGYHTKIGMEGVGISQGQRQRILIARSIYKSPELILFDEATNALDANNEAAITRNLETFFKGRTVIIVAHRLSTVKNADQIIVLEKGELVETGSHSQLVAARGKYFELVSNQLELAP